MDRFQAMDSYLKSFANIINDNPNFDFTVDTFYNDLRYLGIPENYNKEANLPLFEKWENRYKKNKHQLVYQDTRQMSFMQFRSYDGIRQSEAFKLYLSYPPEIMEDAVNRIMDFIVKKKIKHSSKVYKNISNDQICLRILEQKDLMKLIDFISKDKLLRTNYFIGNPFVFREGPISFGYDHELSFNHVLSLMLNSYFHGKKKSNQLNTVSYDDFARYASVYGETLFSSKEGIRFLRCDELFRKYHKDCGDTNLLSDYKNVLELIGNEVQRNFTYKEYLNSVEYYMSDECKKNNKALIDNIDKLSDGPRMDPYAIGSNLLEEYCLYAFKKYNDFDIIVNCLNNFRNENNINAITRDFDFRTRFSSYMPYDIFDKLVNGDIRNYVGRIQNDKLTTIYNALMETFNKYGEKHCLEAIYKGLNGDYKMITNGSFGYRNYLEKFVSSKEFLTMVKPFCDGLKVNNTCSNEFANSIEDVVSSNVRR